MELAEILDRKAVRVFHGGASLKAVFWEIGLAASQAYGLSTRDVAAVLYGRELEASSSVGRGVALPHDQFDGIDRPSGVFLRLLHPLDMHAQDRRDVDLVFALLTPLDYSESDFLKALALIARSLRNPLLQVDLRAHMDRDELHAILTEVAGVMDATGQVQPDQLHGDTAPLAPGEPRFD